MKGISKSTHRTLNISRYPEIRPGTKLLKKSYVFVMLLIVGRAIEAAAKVDESVRKIFGDLPGRFTFYLGVAPGGPYMVFGKDKQGNVKYLGWNLYGRKIDLGLKIKNIESGIKVFTFQESTAQAFAYDRFIVEGNLPQALAVVRVIDIVEVYLLPKVITRLAVKRYPKWSELSPVKKHLNRIRIYLKSFSPSLIKVIYRNL
ncbi:MAG: hypothetical protein ACLFUY_09615 [Desulfobacterales bacterium]